MFLVSPEDSWQQQFVEALRARFPSATISLQTTGPPDPDGTFDSSAPPDLVVTEFSNDASLDAESVYESYGDLADLFASVGSEWAILTPGYARPGSTAPCSPWMQGMDDENGLIMEEDPRPYTQALRSFAADRAGGGGGVALADAALLWGRLYRQGIPFTTLLTNSINHPNRRGMATFAEALLALFPV